MFDFFRVPYVSIVIVGLLGLCGCDRHESSRPLPLFDLTGLQIDPFAAENVKATVFLFARTDCPISNRYAPEVRRLYDRFSSRGVAFWLVYPNPEITAEAIRQHVEDYSYSLQVLCDPQHALVKLTGAQVTPEAAVFNGAGQMLYRGRIDDRFPDFGIVREPKSRDLQDALEAVLDGRPVASETTQAVGCLIQDLK